MPPERFVAKIMYDLPRDTSDVDVLPIASNNEIDSVISMALEGSELHLLDPWKSFFAEIDAALNQEVASWKKP